MNRIGTFCQFLLDFFWTASLREKAMGYEILSKQHVDLIDMKK